MKQPNMKYQQQKHHRMIQPNMKYQFDQKRTTKTPPMVQPVGIPIRPKRARPSPNDATKYEISI